MATSDTIKTLERLRLLSEGGDDSVFTPAQKGWISKLHKDEFGEPVKECGCKNKYTDAVTLLLLKIRRRGTTEAESRYKLRRGVLIWINTECYSCHNLTDEIAEKWLAAHPEGVGLFEKIEK